MPTPSNPYRPFVVLGSVVLVVAALYWAQKVLIPIALAVLLSFILSPLVIGLQKRRIGRIPSVMLVVTLAFAIVGGTGVAITHELNGLLAELPAHRENIRHRIAQFRETGKGTVFDKVQRMIEDLTQEIVQDEQQVAVATKEPVDVRIQQSGLSRIQSALGPAAEALANVTLVLVLVIFMLVQREDLRNRLVRLIANGGLISATRAIDEATRGISRYLLSQVLINAGFCLLLSACLFAIGVPYAFLWGFLAGILRFIPYAGTWVAMALMVAFSVVIFPAWTRPLLVAGVFVLLEVLTGNFVEPFVFGRNTGLSSVALLVAAAFWTWLWGPIGLVLSTPISVCLAVLGKHVADLEFFDILLSDQPVLDVHVRYYQRLLARDQDEAIELVEENLQERPVEGIYDEVLVPALVLAKRDKQRGELNEEDERFILTVTRDLIEDVGSSQRTGQSESAEVANDAAENDRPRVAILGCPARDEEDELALHMFRVLLGPAGYQVEVLSSTMLAAEVIARVAQEETALVCIATLPPAGLTRARYLCKRLHVEFPNLKILVGYWGGREKLGPAAERIQAAGAAHVGTTLIESRNQAIPLIQTLAHAEDALTRA